jgi:hypothetical protein
VAAAAAADAATEEDVVAEGAADAATSAARAATRAADTKRDPAPSPLLPHTPTPLPPWLLFSLGCEEAAVVMCAPLTAGPLLPGPSLLEGVQRKRWSDC